MRYFPSSLTTSINSELTMIDHQSYLLQIDLCPEIIHYILKSLKKFSHRISPMQRLKLSIISHVCSESKGYTLHSHNFLCLFYFDCIISLKTMRDTIHLKSFFNNILIVRLNSIVWQSFFIYMTTIYTSQRQFSEKSTSTKYKIQA